MSFRIMNSPEHFMIVGSSTSSVSFVEDTEDPTAADSTGSEATEPLVEEADPPVSSTEEDNSSGESSSPALSPGSIYKVTLAPEKKMSLPFSLAEALAQVGGFALVVHFVLGLFVRGFNYKLYLRSVLQDSYRVLRNDDLLDLPRQGRKRGGRKNNYASFKDSARGKPKKEDEEFEGGGNTDLEANTHRLRSMESDQDLFDGGASSRRSQQPLSERS
mmetsp:Transcript_39102/g.59637  ORF Transcript_39102/g.59637 Transcript_39102/m.59637 type:complete len:217 (-) Transcript_39102:1535-2185(-)